MTNNPVKVRYFLYSLIIFVSYFTHSKALATHSKGKQITIYTKVEVKNYLIKIKFSKAEALFLEFLPIFKEDLSTIATTLAEIFKTNSETENLHSNCATAYNSISQIGRGFNIFKRARELLPQINIPEGETNHITLNLLPAQLKTRFELIHSQLTLLRTWTSTIDTTNIQTFFVGEELTKLKKFSRSALIISHHINQMRISFIDITLGLSELFSVGLISSRLIKALSVIANESNEGVELSPGDRHFMLGCELKTTINCLVRKEAKTSPKTVNHFKSLIFNGCMIKDSFFLDEVGTPYIEERGDINLFLPIKPSPCLKGIMAEDLNLIRKHCKLEGKVSETFRLIEDGIIIFKSTFETNKIVNTHLNRTPKKDDFPFKVQGKLSLKFQNFIYKVSTKNKAQFLTLKNQFEDFAFCPLEENSELISYFENLFLPLGGTNTFLVSLTIIFSVFIYISFSIKIKKLKVKCSRENDHLSLSLIRPDRRPTRTPPQRHDVNNQLRPQGQHAANQRTNNRRIFSERVIRQLLRPRT